MVWRLALRPVYSVIGLANIPCSGGHSIGLCAGWGGFHWIEMAGVEEEAWWNRRFVPSSNTKSWAWSYALKVLELVENVGTQASTIWQKMLASPLYWPFWISKGELEDLALLSSLGKTSKKTFQKYRHFTQVFMVGIRNVSAQYHQSA